MQFVSASKIVLLRYRFLLVLSLKELVWEEIYLHHHRFTDGETITIIFLVGHRQKTDSDVFFIHTRENDIVELMLDCTKKIIRYKIERTQKSEELSINMNKCPFPWQLYISLGGRGDQIRLLNNTCITTL
jgi:hypothetical protein